MCLLKKRVRYCSLGNVRALVPMMFVWCWFVFEKAKSLKLCCSSFWPGKFLGPVLDLCTPEFHQKFYWWLSYVKDLTDCEIQFLEWYVYSSGEQRFRLSCVRIGFDSSNQAFFFHLPSKGWGFLRDWVSLILSLRTFQAVHCCAWGERHFTGIFWPRL